MKYIMPPMTVFEDPFWKGLQREFTDKRIFDRTHTLDLPYEQVDISPIPEYKHTEESLTTISRRVAEDLVRQGHHNIHIMWSGGIDSTNIVAAFKAIQYPITVVHSKESVVEFPEFYNSVVKDCARLEFKDIREVLLDLSEKDWVTIVGGEFGDYCTREVGIANKKGWVSGTGFTWSVDEGIPEDRRAFLRPVLEAAPFDLEDIDDEFWWLFWTMKWQLNAYRWHHLVRKKIDNLVQFYEHPLIQNWSMSNPSRKHNKEIHKYPIKESIFEYFPEECVWEMRKHESTPQVVFIHDGRTMAQVHEKARKMGLPNWGGPYKAWINSEWQFGGYELTKHDTIPRLKQANESDMV